MKRRGGGINPSYTQPQSAYLLVDEGLYGDKELASLDNVVAALFRLENSLDMDTVLDALQGMMIWLKEPDQDSLRRSITVWFNRVFLKRVAQSPVPEFTSLTEVHAMLAESADRMKQGWIAEGEESRKVWKWGWKRELKEVWREG